jgi:hypothetical protein
MVVPPITASASDRVNRSRVAWLTTLRSDGSPHTTPVWFVYIGGALWVASGQRNVKVRNVRNHHRVSFAIDGSADAPLVAEGTVEVIELVDPNALADVGVDVDVSLGVDVAVTNAFREKYDGWDIHDATVDGPRTLLRIYIARWLLAS